VFIRSSSAPARVILRKNEEMPRASQGALASDFKLGHYPFANEFRDSNSRLND